MKLIIQLDKAKQSSVNLGLDGASQLIVASSAMGLVVAFRGKTVVRIAGIVIAIILVRSLFSTSAPPHEITKSNYVERLTKGKANSLDVQRLPFLQSRIGRDERPDILDEYIDFGIDDFWKRYQLPL